MPISFGGSNIGAIYVGGTPIKEVYSGGTLVWSASKTPYDLGAKHWLRFDANATTDTGTNPATWSQTEAAVSAYSLRYGSSSATTGLQVNPSSGFGFSVWVNAQQATTSSAIELVGNFCGLTLSPRYNASNFAMFTQLGSGASFPTYITEPPSPGSWHMFAVFLYPVSGNSWERVCYLDAVEVDKIPFTHGGTPPTITAASVNTRGGAAWLDDAAFYNKALSAADVAALYSSGRSG